MPELTEITQYLPGILLSYLALLVGVVSPGPALLGLMGVSLDRGRLAGQSFALGIGTGSFSIGLLTLTGLSAVLAAYADAMTAIRIFGGLYLLWLSYRAFRTAFRKPVPASANDDVPISDPITRKGYYLRGLALHRLYPWCAALGGGCHRDRVRDDFNLYASDLCHSLFNRPGDFDLPACRRMDQWGAWRFLCHGRHPVTV